jgi:hypothetical protein
LPTLADDGPGKKRWPVIGSLEAAQSMRPKLTGAANRSPLWGSSRLAADIRIRRLNVGGCLNQSVTASWRDGPLYP